MIMKHLILEVYCDCQLENGDKLPYYCLNGINNPGSHCFENACKFLSYTDCPHEIAYSGELGIVESSENFIGFGGEMEPESNDISERNVLLSKWNDICVKKISEAYDEYMQFKIKTKR